ncbi:hypothetical protein CEUSTIGMA_g5992.t1 [Chlamydomonas eustigma]|uniref:Uncharacterized protein n=1 Tax=Chlamydomonas eustigma TaxID=1157962 RepID=A0A250X6P1_9CHLO|nr:hypothetical protein CEUSTIGMA_g5992.t1 [Chlamydomonas eustigma]|eukprot:GAX78552.1 hypothetical protein CEUSTIGMA_g5992.t1 [Chlamydomonas eustigma]
MSSNLRWSLRGERILNLKTEGILKRKMLEEACTPHELAAALKIEQRMKRAEDRHEFDDDDSVDATPEASILSGFKACSLQKKQREDSIIEQAKEEQRLASMTKVEQINEDTLRYNSEKQAAASARGAARDAVNWAAETVGLRLQPGIFEYNAEEMVTNEAPSYEDDAYGPENAGLTFRIVHKIKTPDQSSHTAHAGSSKEIEAIKSSFLDMSTSSSWLLFHGTVALCVVAAVWTLKRRSKD